MTDKVSKRTKTTTTNSDDVKPTKKASARSSSQPSTRTSRTVTRQVSSINRDLSPNSSRTNIYNILEDYSRRLALLEKTNKRLKRTSTENRKPKSKTKYIAFNTVIKNRIETDFADFINTQEKKQPTMIRIASKFWNYCKDDLGDNAFTMEQADNGTVNPVGNESVILKMYDKTLKRHQQDIQNGILAENTTKASSASASD